MISLKDARIGIVGLGYVGLPLAVAFAEKYRVVGYDIKLERIQELASGLDKTLEVSEQELAQSINLQFTNKAEDLKECDIYIVTVPTPVDSHKRPDLSPLFSASETIGQFLFKDNIVVYESTVYPGATEEECVPILERVSGLKLNQDFFVGYSPERINPGDKLHRVVDIIKVTSGSTLESAECINQLYQSIITAGTFRAESIRVAEAAKVIENTQRDLNIALMNELAIIFNRLGIDTEAVLKAAGTKWNFLPFRPGLVAGHCIGVDPYYLTHKAQAIGYHPEIILAGRRLNDSMGAYVAAQLVKAMTKRRIQVDGARVLVMGVTFKENCPDLRNTRVVDIITELGGFNCNVDVYDPWVTSDDARNEYGITTIAQLNAGVYDAIIIAVAHHQFKSMGAAAIRSLGKPTAVLYDLKYVFLECESDLRL